jgi:hypothetical protein
LIESATGPVPQAKSIATGFERRLSLNRLHRKVFAGVARNERSRLRDQVQTSKVNLPDDELRRFPRGAPGDQFFELALGREGNVVLEIEVMAEDMGKQFLGFDPFGLALPVVDRVGIHQHPLGPVDQSFGIHGDASYLRETAASRAPGTIGGRWPRPHTLLPFPRKRRRSARRNQSTSN